MSAKKLLEIVEKRHLLEDAVLAELRRQFNQQRGKVTAELIAKQLVEQGHLTKFQASKLVAEATAGQAAETTAGQAPGSRTDNDDLGLAPDPDAPPADDAVDADAAALEGLTPVEDAGAALTPVEAQPRPAGKKWQETGSAAGRRGPNAPPAAGGLMPLDGGLEPLGAGDLTGFGAAGGLDPFGLAPPTAPAQEAGARLPTPRQQRWDTKLMLGGMMALLIMLLIGGAIWYNLTKATPVEMLNAAEDAYNKSSWSDAEGKFQEYLKRFPRDDKDRVSKAKVRLVLCRLRVVTDPDKRMELALELLPTVENETQFNTAREELPTLLPEIPEAFAKRANIAEDLEKKEAEIRKAETAMEKLVNEPKYIMSKHRAAIQKRLDDINETITTVNRTINRERQLVAATVEIAKAVAANDTPAAFEHYQKLTNEYPGLARDERLIKSVLTITDQERQRVSVTTEALAATVEPPARQSEFLVVVANRSGETINPLKDEVAVVHAGSSVYGLDASSGRLLWRHFVGYGATPQPVPISNQAGADLICSDSQHHALFRVEARTGKIVWRLVLGEPFQQPIMAGERLLVSTTSGKIWQVQLEDGSSPRQVTVPQPVTTGVGIAGTRGLIFQPGRHTNLYVMSLQDLSCQTVQFVGHREGSIIAPPIVMQDLVFVVDNFAPEHSNLHVFALQAEGEPALMLPAQAPLPLEGNVIVSMQSYGRRLLVLTDRGQINLFDIDRANKDQPVTVAASNPAFRTQPAFVYPLAEGNSLWMADDQLASYEIQVTTKKVLRQSVSNVGDVFAGPLRLLGNVLIHTRRLKGSPGYTVTAINVDKPLQPLWTTHLGVPAGRVLVTNGKIQAISASGALFDISREVLQAGLSSDPVQAVHATGSLSFTQAIELGEGNFAFFNPTDQASCLAYRPGNAAQPLSVIQLKLPASPVTCNPVLYQQGLLLPTASGTIVLCNTVNGDQLCLPFQPPLEPGSQLVWRRPAVVGNDVVLVDDRQNIYRLTLSPQPKPNLSQVKQNKLDVNIASDLATLGSSLCGVVRETASDKIVVLNPEDLTVAKQHALAGHVVWGPVTVGDVVFCLSDHEGLICLQADGEPRWPKLPVAEPVKSLVMLAGPPLPSDGDYLLAGVNGAVWRVSGADGTVSVATDVGEPLGSAPSIYSDRLLLCGSDGAIHILKLPAANSGG